MYLADSLRTIASGLDDTHPLMASAHLRYMRHRARDVLDRFDLIAFTRSAMAMAADLRIDTPERLEGIAEAVFRDPRRVFIEAPYVERLDAFKGIRGFPHVELPEGRYNPAKVGLAIEVYGQGRGRIGVLWNFSKKLAASGGPLLPPGARTKLAREAEVEMSRFGVGMAFIEVDAGGAGGLTRAAFEARYSTGDQSLAAIRHAVARLDIGPGARAERQRLNEAWRLYRLNQISRINPDPDAVDAVMEFSQVSGQSIDAIIENAERDLDGEIIYAIALLAALEADQGGLEHQVRAAAPARRARQVSRRDLPTDRLSVVHLRLGDRELERAVAKTGRDGTGSGAPRIRHPVRGHLFRARNGKIVYRRPHWRGSLDGKRITRVSR